MFTQTLEIRSYIYPLWLWVVKFTLGGLIVATAIYGYTTL